MTYTCRPATPDDLVRIWQKNIDANPGDDRWPRWRDEYIAINQSGAGQTFVVCADGEPVGEGTLLFSPACSAVRGRLALADGAGVTNLNALRIEKAHEGRGQISRLVKMMEQTAAARGCSRVTIGVEPGETRNLAIYLHWGYTEFVTLEQEDEGPVLYYAKSLG